MSSSYEERLATFTNWPHNKPSAQDVAAAGFFHGQFGTRDCRPDTKDLSICSECELEWCGWTADQDPLQQHLYIDYCSLAQALKAKKAALTAQKAVKLGVADAAVSSKPRSKAESSRSSKSFKSEEFAVSPSSSSAPAKPTSEPIIKSDVVLAASSASIPACMSILDTEKIEAEEAPTVAQEAMKQEAAAAAIEAIKPEACAKDIGFFDPTMQIDLWEEFRISAFSASFLQHLAEVAAKYREKSVIKILSQCLRGSALQWLKDQPKFTSLKDFKLAMTNAFPSAEPAANPDSVIINPSPRYHTCPECSIQFSSISRLLTHAQKGCNKAYTCKHCEEAFTSNNKLHEHVRLHHISKSYSNKTLRQRFAEEGDSHINLPISRPTSSTTSRSMAASTRPLLLAIPMAKAPVACPPTPPPSPPRTSVLSHTAPKTYTTMKELFEMFAGKISKRSMNIIQKRPTSPCSPEPRQTRIKPLRQQGPKETAMLAGRQSRRSLNAIRKRMSSPFSPMPGQTKITSYFKPAGQSNPTSAKSAKSSTFTSCPSSAPRPCPPANRAAGTPQYRRIATDETPDLETQQKTKNCSSSRPFGQEYIAVAGVDHTNKDIRVETPLTNAKGYNSVKSSAKSAEKLKSSISSSRPSSTPRACSPANQDARTPHIAPEANLTSLIKSRIKTRASTDQSGPRYLAAAGVDHTNKAIRVETPLTNAEKYNSVKSSIKSSVKRFKSSKSAVSISSLNSAPRPCSPANNSAPRPCSPANRTAGTPQHQHIATDGAPSLGTQQKLKSSISSSRLSSASRACFPANQVAGTPQYQHIATGKAKLPKSLKSAVFISSLSTALRSSLPANHEIPQILISMPSRTDLLRALIHQVAYAPISSRLRRFRQRYIDAAAAPICT